MAGLLEKITSLTAFGVSATYWPPLGVDDNGQPNFSTPMTIGARWTDKSEMFRDAQGREVMSLAEVFTSIDVKVGGYLYLGESAAAEPGSVAGAFEIRRFDKIPNKKQTKFLRKATL